MEAVTESGSVIHCGFGWFAFEVTKWVTIEPEVGEEVDSETVDNDSNAKLEEARTKSQ
jgi:hypothetical protein